MKLNAAVYFFLLSVKVALPIRMYKCPDSIMGSETGNYDRPTDLPNDDKNSIINSLLFKKFCENSYSATVTTF